MKSRNSSSNILPIKDSYYFTLQKDVYKIGTYSLQYEHFQVGTYLQRNVLVKDASPFDLSINDIPSNGLHDHVSGILNIPYLSRYEGAKKQFQHNLKYLGKIIGDHSRVFLSIPTAGVKSQQYYYVHYLLCTGYPQTTLTHQVLCCLLGKKVDDHNVHFPSLMQMLIGGKKVQIHLSNPNPKEKNPIHNYYNVNRLGMNFLREFRQCNLVIDPKKREACLELIV